jgi:hypothetical protein
MRLLMMGVALSLFVASGSAAAEQGSGTKGRQFTGIKLADMHARTPEQTVTVALEDDVVRITDPKTNKDVKTFQYSGLKVSHTLSNVPPPSAGNPESAQTQRGQAPTYMGREERNWLTLQSGSDTATLRVSSKVYDELKAALHSHGVTVEETK